MTRVLVAFAFGVWIAQQQAQLVPWPLAAAALVIPVGAALWVARRVRIPAVSFLATAIACLIGSSYASLRAHMRLSEALTPELEGAPMLVVGVVSNLPHADGRGVRFNFDVEQVDGRFNHQVPHTISLTWSAGRLADEVPAVRAGERWQLAVRLKRPHGFSNTHGFDVEVWLLEQGVRATGAVSSAQNLTGAHQRLDRDAGRIRDRVDRLRERARERIVRTLEHSRWAQVIVALALGDQRGISPQDYALFERTGISHLLSISGAHVTFFAAMCGAFVFAVCRRSHRLTLRLPARKAAALAAFLAALLYAMFSGFAVPAQRTVYMVGAAAVALWSGRTLAPSVILSSALALVLLIDPWAVMSAGFWFSFCAVAILLSLSAYRVGAQPWWMRAAVTQLAITLALAPISLAFFQNVSLIGLLVNAVAIPWVSFVVVPLCLLALVVPWPFLLQLAHTSFAWLADALTWIGASQWATWQQHAPVWWTLPFAVVGVLWLIAPRGIPQKPLALALLVPMFLVTPDRAAPGTFTLTALDVGQGQAMVVQTASHDLLYDAGPLWTDESDAGQRVVVPYLRATGARRGAMIVSHQDSDHSGGAAAVLAAAKIDWWASSMRPSEIQSEQTRAIPFLRCTAGQSFLWDDVHFEVLHPSAEDYDVGAKSNDLSCVVRIVGKNGESALLVGDVEAIAEKQLIARSATLKSDILSMPHHGSRTSSTTEFIDAVAPKIAVVNAGYRNRFGHPRADVLTRYAQGNVQVDRTDWDGAITYRFSPERGWRAVKHRDAHRRYWTDRPEQYVSPLE